jgi:hypothetical protein
MELLTWIEGSALGVWVRESVSLWAYPGLIAFHAIGLAFVVGLSVAIDLRLLGVAPGLPLAPFEKLFPVMWAGFWLNALSGVALTVAYATTMLVNPVFLVKLVFIALAVVNLRLIKVRVFGAARRSADAPAIERERALAWSSLVLWTGAIATGRLIAYTGLLAETLGLGGEGGG